LASPVVLNLPAFNFACRVADKPKQRVHLDLYLVGLCFVSQELRMELVPSILIAATLLTTLAVTFDFHGSK
jgi:hypothetical protein